MEAELATLAPVYHELYALTAARVGDRALELLLPAVALALCYTEPHNAYGPMLSALAASPPKETVDYGRKVAANLPPLPQAGAILGTSIQVRRNDDSYRVYDKFIDDLEAVRWGFDAYAALAEPTSMNRIGGFAFTIVTTDSFFAPKISMTSDEVYARMAIMAAVLRVAGRRGREREIREFQLAWARDALNRLLGPPPDRGEQAPGETA